jgi:hypothetical protein
MNDGELFKSAIFLYYFDSDNQITEIISILNKIKNWEFLTFEAELKIYTLKFLQNVKSNKMLNDLISDFSVMFFINSILSSELLNELLETIQLLERHFGFNFKSKFENKFICEKYKSSIKEIYELCQILVQEEIDASYEYLSKNIDVDAKTDIINKIEDYLEFINYYMFENFQMDYIILTSQNWNEIAERNYSDYLIMGKKYDLESLENHDEYNYDEYTYDEYYDEYDYEKEKINSSLPFQPSIPVKIIEEFDDDLLDDFPF